MPKLILILGGARSGKSTTAERLAREIGGNEVLYIATAQAGDDEMRDRIAMHQMARPQGWSTLEAPMRIADSLARWTMPGRDLPPVIVLDCITLLISNVMLTLPESASQSEVNDLALAEISSLLAFYQQSQSTWIVVSNEVGMGVVPPSYLGRLFRDALGMVNQRLATAADEVRLIVAGLPWRLK